MKLLLDTHAFIWWDSEPDRLSNRVRAACEDPRNEIYLSVASAWEMQIKLQLRKFHTRLPLAATIAEQQKANGVRLLSITLEHILALQELPPHHKDPFDRLLIGQAKFERIALVSHDPVFSSYDVELYW